MLSPSARRSIPKDPIFAPEQDKEMLDIGVIRCFCATMVVKRAIFQRRGDIMCSRQCLMRSPPNVILLTSNFASTENMLPAANGRALIVQLVFMLRFEMS